MTEQETQEFATSTILFEFYRTLVAVQANAIDYVRQGESRGDMENRARALMGRLREFSQGRCPGGTHYDPVLGACVFMLEEEVSKPADTEEE